MLTIFLKQALFITKQRFQLEVCHQKELREKGPGYLISCGDLCHFPVDTLMQPREPNDMDTGMEI